MSTAYPFARPLYVMAKAAGPRCNLRCKYCYYLEKQHLVNSKKSPSSGGGLEGGYMSDELLEAYVRDYIQLQQVPEVLFTWHGGEPMLRPLSFYKQAVRYQQYYGRGRQISNCIQTNGTLLTSEWCQFLHDEGWLVGISIDGTQQMHDAYRLDAKGEETWQRVMNAIQMLQDYHVEWNAMATVNHANVGQPLEFYKFFRDELHCQFLQLSPIVERVRPTPDPSRGGRGGAEYSLVVPPGPFSPLPPREGSGVGLAPFSVKPDEWGRFLCTIFDEWVKHDVGETFVNVFDATLAGWMGVTPGICVYAEECGHAVVMEHNGDIYSCDHFVFPQYRLGNIRQQGLPQIIYGEKQTAFSRLKKESLPRQCRQCEWLKACHGECPRLRFLHTADGEPGLNYLCAGYRMYFQHVAPYMDFMRNELLAGRPAYGVMRAF
ncbi:MAG: anaerobic sulfatase-maturation protein [Bacteroidaceae bacterium]|nr:anaerobic sulfatase-maturation protein [Bacteroidaceae bacterium]